MKKSIIKIVLWLLVSQTFDVSAQGNNKNRFTAEQLITNALKEIGGEKWREVKSIYLEGYGYQNTIDQSERPEGPFIPMQFSRTILKDRVNSTALLKQSSVVFNFKSNDTYMFDNGYAVLKQGAKLHPTQQAQELLCETELAPDVILQQALSSRSLSYVKDTVLQQVSHRIISFKWMGYPVRLFLNAETNLLTGVEVTKPFKSDYAGLWGDTKKLMLYSFWNLLDDGLHYPLQQDSYINGWYKSSFLINKWQVNVPVGVDSLTIPRELKLSELAIDSSNNQVLKKRISQGQSIAKGISVIAGPCNTTIVEQTDGLIVIEGPHSSFYTAAVIDQLKKVFPKKRIKALIATSDAWLHIGGIRSYAALASIKIYYPYRNGPLLKKLLNSTYFTEPDDFAKSSNHSYTLVPVKDSMAIGRGSDRLVLYPYKTETGDRMMMVYFPAQQLLYASDLYQPKDRKGQYWEPHMELEVYQSIKKLKLDVKQFYGMHTRVIPYADLENDFKKYND